MCFQIYQNFCGRNRSHLYHYFCKCSNNFNFCTFCKFVFSMSKCREPNVHTYFIQMAIKYWDYPGLSASFYRKKTKAFLVAERIMEMNWGKRERESERKEKKMWNHMIILWACEVCSTSSVLTKHVCKGIPRFCGEHYFEAFHFTKMECVRKLMVIACQEWEAWLKCCPLLLTGRNWGTFWDGEGSGNYSNHQRQTAGVSITPKAVMHSNSHVMTPGSL